ncbi:hypothetical protein SKAU_G00257850 [Synaphobranchus kaupii]|uniref:Uncharacterized protein n=1 Tax=Synaphobranchus kaupii TaxID=118154 RepID=A0A9Q1F453_SYNKA|nr:hypothetical protein SKAU_G00257850 [Synaphobranchus kaupii]
MTDSLIGQSYDRSPIRHGQMLAGSPEEGQGKDGSCLRVTQTHGPGERTRTRYSRTLNCIINPFSLEAETRRIWNPLKTVCKSKPGEKRSDSNRPICCPEPPRWKFNARVLLSSLPSVLLPGRSVAFLSTVLSSPTGSPGLQMLPEAPGPYRATATGPACRMRSPPEYAGSPFYGAAAKAAATRQSNSTMSVPMEHPNPGNHQRCWKCGALGRGVTVALFFTFGRRAWRGDGAEIETRRRGNVFKRAMQCIINGQHYRSQSSGVKCSQ